MISREVLCELFAQVLDQLQDDVPIADAVLSSAENRPLGIVLVIDDPVIAAKFAALLPQLRARLGVT